MTAELGPGSSTAAIVRAFLGDSVDQRIGARVRSSDLYFAYVGWCLGHQYAPQPMGAFCKALSASVQSSIIHRHDGSWRIGFGLNARGEADMRRSRRHSEIKPLVDVRLNHNMNGVPMNSSMTSMEFPLREPTTKEIAAIARSLDESFDSLRGAFVEGHNDRTIGAKLNLPWAIVQKVREELFGPLKSSSEIDALNEQLEALNQLVRNETRDIRAKLAKLMPK